MTVYRLQKGQNRYRKNVINFLQNIQEFTNWLLRHLLLLDVFVVRCQLANNATAFRDFTI